MRDLEGTSLPSRSGLGSKFVLEELICTPESGPAAELTSVRTSARRLPSPAGQPSRRSAGACHISESSLPYLASFLAERVGDCINRGSPEVPHGIANRLPSCTPEPRVPTHLDGKDNEVSSDSDTKQQHPC